MECGGYLQKKKYSVSSLSWTINIILSQLFDDKIQILNVAIEVFISQILNSNEYVSFNELDYERWRKKYLN